MKTVDDLRMSNLTTKYLSDWNNKYSTGVELRPLYQPTFPCTPNYQISHVGDRAVMSDGLAMADVKQVGGTRLYEAKMPAHYLSDGTYVPASTHIGLKLGDRIDSLDMTQLK